MLTRPNFRLPAPSYADMIVDESRGKMRGAYFVAAVAIAFVPLAYMAGYARIADDQMALIEAAQLAAPYTPAECDAASHDNSQTCDSLQFWADQVETDLRMALTDAQTVKARIDDIRP